MGKQRKITDLFNTTGPQPPNVPIGQNLGDLFNPGKVSVNKSDWFDPNADQGVSFTLSQEQARAQNQSGERQASNALGRVLVNTLPTVVGNVASILDFEDYWNQDTEVGNAITRAMEEVKESNNEMLPIYRENPDTPLDLGDPAWWFQNGSSVAESAGAFAITGFGLGGILGKGAQGLKWLSTLGQSSRITKAGQAGASILNAVGLNQAESITTAIGVYDEIYQNELERSGNIELAKQNASEAASYSININRANILLNLTSAAAFVKSGGSTRELIKKFGAPSKYFGEAAQEYVEEDINLYSEKAGQEYGKALMKGEEYDKGFDIGDLLDIAMSAEGVEAGLLGAVGGIAQTGATDIGRRLLGRDKNEREKRQQQQAYIQTLEDVFGDANIPNAAMLTDFTQSIAPLIQAKNQIIEDNESLTPSQKSHISQIEDMILAKQANYAFKLGTTESLIEMYQKIGSLEPEEAAAKGFTGEQLNERSPNYYRTRAKEAVSKIESFEKIYNKAQNYTNTRDVYNNRIQQTILRGRVESVNNDIASKEAEIREFYESLPDYGVSDFKASIDPVSFYSPNPETPKEKAALTKLQKRVQESSLQEELNELKSLKIKYEKGVAQKNESYNDLISSKKQKEIKQKAEQAKEDKKVRDAALSAVDEGSSVADLKKARDAVKTKEIQEELDKVIEEKKDINKQQVKNTAQSGGTAIDPPAPPMDITPPSNQDIPQESIPEEDIPSVEPPELDDIDAVFGPVVTPWDEVDIPDVVEPAQELIQDEIIAESPPIEEENKSSEEQITPPPTPDNNKVMTRLKEYAGNWTTDDEGNRIFNTELNPDGTPVIQMYTNQETGEQVPPSEVWESLDNGTLVINTPLVNEGTEVELVIEPNWTYWKSDNPVDVPINIYRIIDGKRSDKPLTQLPRTDRTNSTTAEFRNKVLSEGGLRTYISSKNIGDFLSERYEDGTRRRNNLSNLEQDWVRKDNSWEMGPVQPILGIVRPGEGGVVMTFPNVQNIVQDDEQLGEDVENAELTTPAAPGTVVTLRRAPNGRLIPAQIDPSQLTPEEVVWVKNELPNLLMEKRFSEIADVIHIPRLTSSSEAAKFDLDWGLVGNGIIFKYTDPDTKEVGWIEMDATDKYGYFFGNFMKGKNYVYSVIDKDGNFKKHGADRNKFFESKRLPQEMKAEFKKQFDQIVSSRYRNVNKNRVNTLDDFTNPVTGETYDNYYEFLKQTNSVTTDLPQGNSFGNASIYLKPIVTKEKTNEETIQEVQPEDKPVTPPKGDWKSMVDLRKFRTYKPIPGMNTVSQKEVDWLVSKFDEDAIKIAKGVDKALSVGGIEAFGYYHDAMIHLAEMAEEGTGYHEAFHFVFDQQLDTKEKEAILNEAAKIYGIKRSKGKNEPKLRAVDYELTAVDILSSDKAIQIFNKGEKNNWTLDKTLTELQIPKEQKQLILDKGLKNREDIITSILVEDSFVIEINTAKITEGNLALARARDDIYEDRPDLEVGSKEFEEAVQEKLKQTTNNTAYYSNLTVPGGTNYTENEIRTPDITPSIKGHAQFSTDQGIGWFRSDEKALKGEIFGSQFSGYQKVSEGKITDPSDIDDLKEDLIDGKITAERFTELTGLTNISQSTDTNKIRRILEVQSDLFQKGRDKKDLIKGAKLLNTLETETVTEEYEKDGFLYFINGGIYTKNDLSKQVKEEGKFTKITKEEYEKNIPKIAAKEDENKNQFLQLLNKSNNWTTFFVKSVIQDSNAKGYEKVLFPAGDTAAKIEGHQTLEEFKRQKEARIKELEEDKKFAINGFIEDIDYDDMGRPEMSKIPIEQIDREINRLKQELVDVESGQTQLSSIASFYENTVHNILKKQGFKPERIKDEYGNEWFEIDLSKVKDIDLIKLRTPSSEFYKGLSGDTQLEERLAEDFRTYMLSEGKIKPPVKKARNFFERLWAYIKKALGYKTSIENLFEDIAYRPFSAGEMKKFALSRERAQREGDSIVKFKLIPGLTAKAQQSALQAASNELMLIALENATDQKSIDDLVVENLESYIGVVKTNFQKYFNTLQQEFSSKPSQELANRLYILDTVLNVWDEDFETEIKKSLLRYGFSVSISGKQIEPEFQELVDEQLSELQEEDEQERVHDLSFTLRNPRATLSHLVRRGLSTIPEYQLDDDGKVIRDDNGNPKTVKTILGTPQFLEFNKVYSVLSVQLAGTKDIQSKLNELAEKNSVILAVKDYLDMRKEEGAHTFDGFYSQFMTNFNKYSWEFITVKYQNRDGVETPFTLDTNRKSINKAIISTWRNNAIQTGLIDSSGNVNEKKGKSLLARLDKLRSPQIPYDYLKSQFISIAKDIGIEIPETALATIDQSKAKLTDLRRYIFGKSSATLEQILIRFAEGSNAFENESRAFQRLSSLVEDTIEDVQATGFIDEKGNLHTAVNLTTYLTDKITELKTKKGLKFVTADKFYSPSPKYENKFVSLLRDKDSDVEIKLLSALRKGTQVKDYTDNNSIDSILTRIGYFHNNGSNKAYISLGVLSDKKQQATLSLPKQGDAREFIRSVLKGTVAQEKVRIQRIRNNQFPKEVKNYSKGDKFLYIPELNEIDGLADRILDGEKSIEDVLRHDTQVDQVIDQFINKQLETAYHKLESLGIVQLNDKGNIISHTLPEFVDQKGVKNFLDEFILTDIGWRMEVSKVLAGDIAFYKSPVDYVKRMYQVITPGLQPHVEPEYKSASHKKNIRRIVFKEITKINDEDYLLSLAKLIDPDVKVKELKEAIEDADNKKPLFKYSEAVRIAASYRLNNKTDAQGYCSIEFWRDQTLGLGTWTNDHEFLYQRAWKEGKSISSVIKDDVDYWKKKEGELLLQPFKPFYFGDRQVVLDDGSTMILKEQFKESLTPVLPEWANQHKSFQKLLELFSGENKADIVSAEDAVKVGLHGAVEWTEMTKDSALKFPASYLRYPLTIPTEKKINKAGTQLEKLILANILPESMYALRDGRKVSGAELIQEFHGVWSDIIQSSSNRLMNKLGLKEGMTTEDNVKFLSNLRIILEEDLINREAPDNFFQSIRDRGDGEFTLDLAFPAFGKRFEGILMNLFRKDVITQRFPGYSMVNMADFGTGTSDELKFIRNQSGKVVEAEIGIPYELAEKVGIEAIDGKITWSNLTDNQKKALQVVVYRIPTQGKNSAIPVRVVRVLPKSAGSVIMLPGEGTTQGGFDFDVDKSFMMFPTINKKGEYDHNNKYNKLLDLHWAILTSPLHAEELLNPLDSDLHDRVIDKLGSRPEEDGTSVFNLAFDLDSETLAKYSKSMIGVFSKFAVAHATMQSIPEMVQVSTPLNIVAKGYEFNKVGNVRDNKGLYISNNHSMLQNSALDAQKDPKLGYLNIITFNASTAAYMTSLGLDQESMLYFMNQPVLKEVTAAYLRGNSSIDTAIAAVLEKYPALDSSYRKALKDRIATITVSNLKQMIPIEESVYSGQILADFKQYYHAAQDMNKVNTALSTDTVKDFSGIAALLQFTSTVDYATGPDTSVRIDKEVFNPSASPVKRVAAMYEYGVKKALDLANRFYPYNTEGFKSVTKQVAIDTHIKDGLITDKETLDLINTDTYNYLLSSGLMELMDRFSPNYRQRFSYSNKSSSMPLYMRKMMSKYPFLEKNAFLRSLLPDPYNDRNTIQLLTFNNTSSDMEKSLLINGWEELLNAPENDIKQFAQDLARFAIETSGFKTGPNSFVDLVPVSFWVESGLEDFQRKLVKAFTEGSAGNIDINDASKFIVRLHPELAPKIRKNSSGEMDVVSKSPDGSVFQVNSNISGGLYSDRTISHWPRFARLETKTGTRLYERQPDTLTFKEIQLLGEPYRYYQFATHGEVKSKHPDHKGKSPTLNKILPEGSEEGLNFMNSETLLSFDSIGLDQQGETTLGEFLDFFIDNVTNKDNLEIAKKLKSNAVDVSSIPITMTEDTSALAVASYNYRDKTISLNPTFFDKTRMDSKTAMNYILHEIIHVYTTKAIFTPETEVEKEFKNNISRLQKEAKNQLGKKYPRTEGFGTPTQRLLQYGLSSEYEFASELFSNVEFRNEVKALNNQSLFRRFIRFIRKLLGLPVSENQIYEKALNSLFGMVDNSTRFLSNPSEIARIDSMLESGELYAKRTLDSMLDILQKGVDRLKKKTKNMQSKFPESVDANQRLENTWKALEELEDKAQLVEYVNVVSQDVGRLERRFNTEKEKDILTSGIINQMYEYLAGYSTIEDIREYVGKHPEKYSDIKSEDKTFLEMLDFLSGRMKRLHDGLDQAQKEKVAEWIVATSSESLSYDKVLEQMEIADRDVTIVNRLTDPIIESRDPLLRSVGLQVLNSLEKARLATENLLRRDGGWLDTNEKYEEWLRKKGVSINNTEKRNSFIIEDRLEHELQFVQEGNIEVIRDKEETKKQANEIRNNEALSNTEKTDQIKSLWRIHFNTYYDKKGKVLPKYVSDKWKFIHQPGNEPLKEYYDLVVKGYIRSQRTAPPHLRPGYRLPSIRKSMFEIVTDAKGLGKLRTIQEGVIDSFTRTYDELDRQATDEEGNPLEVLPVRFIAHQDGKDGRPSKNEISQDVASTTLLFIDQMNRHRELGSVVDTLELAKRTASQRDVAITKRKNLLTNEVVEVKDEQGYTITKPGTQSEAYKQLDTFLRRMVYGQTKKDEGTVNILGMKVDVAKTVDTILKYTGLRLLAMNINLAVSNVATGEVTILKEAVGGNWFKVKDYTYGKKQFFKELPKLAGDLGLRKPKSKFAVVASLYNVLDQERSNLFLGKDTTRARKLLSKDTLGAPNHIGELELKGSLMLSFMNTVKLKSPSGEEVNLYEAYEISKGEAKIKDGYTYKGKPFTQKDMLAIRNRINKFNQLHGIYNRIDSSGMKETSIGRLVLSMRSWLKPGIDARFRTEYFDERLGEVNEGHYVSALKFFHSMFGKNKELHQRVVDLKYLFGVGLDKAEFLTEKEKNSLSQDDQERLVELRKANVKKSLFELYTITALSVLLMTVFGAGGDDDDSFTRYQLARLRRELTSFINPVQAWEILKTPTVALSTIESGIKFAWYSSVGLATGEAFDTFESGPREGEMKILSNIKDIIPLWSQRTQFDRYDLKVNYLERGVK